MVAQSSGYHRRRAVLLWIVLFVTNRVYQAEAIGLSRNPLFSGLYNHRRHAPPAATTHSLQHQKNFQHHHQPYQPPHDAVAASSHVVQSSPLSASSSYNTGVDPYISGSNSIDNAQLESTDVGTVASSVNNPVVTDPLLAQTASNLATAASQTSYSSAGSGQGGYSSGGSSAGVNPYSAGSGGGAGGYGGGSGGGSYGSGAVGGGAYGSGGAGGGIGGGAYGAGAGGYGGAGGLGGGIHGGSAGFGGGSLNSYGAGAGPSYSVSYQQTGPSKADTLGLLSSLAPSLLLSGLLLPLSLALLTNVSGLVTGRKKRDLWNMQDSEEDFDEELKFPLEFDDLDSKISAKDEHFFHVMDSMLEAYSPADADRLSEFVRDRGLLERKNTCLQKLSCMATITNKFKKSEKMRNAIRLLDKTHDAEIKNRIKEGKAAGLLGKNECLARFMCQRLTT